MPTGLKTNWGGAGRCELQYFSCDGKTPRINESVSAFAPQAPPHARILQPRIMGLANMLLQVPYQCQCGYALCWRFVIDCMFRNMVRET